MKKLFKFKKAILLFLLAKPFILYSQNTTLETTKKYKFVNAKTGLTLRITPDTEGESLDSIPFGKVVEVINELPETVNVQGTISNWYEIKYKWNKGYVVSSYLSDAIDSFETKNKKDFFGEWKGDWKCGKENSNIKIKKNGNFSGWLFEGGDDSGCSGSSIKGTWTVTESGEICLKTKTQESCFFIFNNRLIANLYSAPGFKENYSWEYLSGLIKSK